MFGDDRPVCVILDEIDGAIGGSEGKGAINALIQIVKATGKRGNSALRIPFRKDSSFVCMCVYVYVSQTFVLGILFTPLRKLLLL